MGSGAKRGILLSLTVIVLGLAWMMHEVGFAHALDYALALALAAGGILLLTLWGLNKATFVLGLLLIGSGATSVLRTLGYLRLELELPILVVLFGVLLLLAFVLPLPVPAMLREDQEEPGDADGAGDRHQP